MTRTVIDQDLTEDIDERVPVLVIGAGLAGLSTAVFLAGHGVAALVVERHPGTSQQPKARGQFPHTMEALRVAGVEDRFLKASAMTPFAIRIAASVAGPVFHEVLVDDGLDLSALSPAGWADVSQEVAEQILAERAVELGAEIRFRTQLDALSQDADGVKVDLRDLDSGRRHRVRASYLVAADGHRGPVRELAGIGSHGRGVLGSGTGVLFEADLSDLVGDTRVLFHLRNPALPGGFGVVVATDVPDRYAFGVGFDPVTDDLADFTPTRWIELIRTATGRPDLVPALVGGEPDYSNTEQRVADRFTEGRVHLVGDSARVMPPTGGFGGNTAILDGYYLAWKLAMVLSGQAGPGLLDSHDPERRPYSDILVEQQYAAYVDRARPDLRDDTIAAPLDPVSVLFFGYRHLSDAVCREPDDDGAPLENPEHPTGRPGSRAPHVPLSDGRSTVDLFGRGLVLLTGADGEGWPAEVSGVADALGVPIEVHAVGDAAFPAVYGIGSTGAVLVRPDGFVAWRCREAGDGALGLESALRAVLDRPVSGTGGRTA